ncbi:hypothetical protein [Arenicella xantha]|uniref:Chromosome partitioning protein ParB n=1 Tax=Arenicella xantha TaxID=644221 RepID=A0A395JLX3_9GAMM|nr:hypothetical protein [Arenicella xantha]RBP52644.1 hypothetical protein DFR28_10124 [Arenicella xantha]
MKLSNNIVRSFIFTATLAGAGAIGSASAASACKGLDTDACASNSSCRWVEGYERKDGRQVKAFCRSSPVSKKAAKAKSGDEPAK